MREELYSVSGKAYKESTGAQMLQNVQQSFPSHHFAGPKNRVWADLEMWRSR